MNLMVGVDEVGRGPWAGPLVAAAVIWDINKRVHGLKDSKLLKREQRDNLCQKIRYHAQSIGIGWVSVAEIDRRGLTWANRQAMLRAMKCLDVAGMILDTGDIDIVIDGRVDYLKDQYKCRPMVKADQKIPAVSAASIIAKAARDNYMMQMHSLFPNYGFDTHVGYGTKRHALNLSRYGPSSLHRQSFIPIAKLAV